MKENKTSYQVGIVGGGKVGLQLFELFTQSSLARVAFVVDKNQSAPAVAAALADRIPVYSSCNDAIQRVENVDVVFEVTGVPEVTKSVLEAGEARGVQVVTHDAAFVMLSVIQESNDKLRGTVVSEILDVKQQINSSLEGVQGLVESIETVTMDMKMLAINARIEAARVGDQGRGFAVVAQHMTESADSVRDLTKEIDDVNKSIRSASGKIDVSLGKLK